METEIAKKLLDLPEWRLSKDGKWLERRFEFRNFRMALAFVNKAGECAEAQKHHPDIKLGWGYAEFSLQTHDAGGITERDFKLAEAINKVEV